MKNHWMVTSLRSYGIRKSLRLFLSFILSISQREYYDYDIMISSTLERVSLIKSGYRAHYQEFAVVRRESLSFIFIALLQTLTLYHFALDLTDKALELIEYWEEYLKEKKSKEERARRQTQQTSLLLPSSPSTPSSTASGKKKRRKAAKISQVDDITEDELSRVREQLRDLQQINLQLKIDLEKANLEKKSISLRAADRKQQNDELTFQLDLYRARFRKLRPDITLPSLSSLWPFASSDQPIHIDETEREYLPPDILLLLQHSTDAATLFQTSDHITPLFDHCALLLADLKARDAHSLDLLTSFHSILVDTSLDFELPSLLSHNHSSNNDDDDDDGSNNDPQSSNEAPLAQVISQEEQSNQANELSANFT